jgi:cysteine desulfurase / selenocysteine lyase
MGRLLIKQSTSLDIDRIREDFPILQKRINGKKIIYFDSAATGQKPQVVIDALDRFYESGYGKPNEKHKLSEGATEQVEQVRKKVARFIGAKEIDEIVYTSGCTAAINLVATSFSKTELIRGDEILITAMEHHANIIPWQMACERSGAKLKVVPLTATGEVDMDMYEKMITPRTRLVALPHTSHVMGTILEIKEIVRLAHNNGTPVLVDGAQAVPHMAVNMQALGCDF